MKERKTERENESKKERERQIVLYELNEYFFFFFLRAQQIKKVMQSEDNEIVKYCEVRRRKKERG